MEHYKIVRNDKCSARTKRGPLQVCVLGTRWEPSKLLKFPDLPSRLALFRDLTISPHQTILRSQNSMIKWLPSYSNFQTCPLLGPYHKSTLDNPEMPKQHDKVRGQDVTWSRRSQGLLGASLWKIELITYLSLTLYDILTQGNAIYCRPILLPFRRIAHNQTHTYHRTLFNITLIP